MTLEGTPFPNTKFVIGGISSSKYSFNSHVGIESSSQDLHGDAEISFLTSFCVTGVNSTSLF